MSISSKSPTAFRTWNITTNVPSFPKYGQITPVQEQPIKNKIRTIIIILLFLFVIVMIPIVIAPKINAAQDAKRLSGTA